MKKQITIILMLVFCIAIGVFAQEQETTETPRTLTIMLYPYIPDPGNDNFAAMIERLETEFEALYPEVDLTIIMDMNYNTYDTDVLAEVFASTGPNAVEFDLMMLGYVQEQGWIPPVSLPDPNVFPVAVDASTISNELFAIPTRVCSLYLFAFDKEITQASNTQEYIDIIAEIDPNNEYRNLLGEFYGKDSLPIYYTAFYIGMYGAAYAQESFIMPPNQPVIDTMASMFEECTFDGENRCVGEYYAGGLSGAAVDFADGESLSYIGFSESLNYIQNINSTDVYVSPAPFGDYITPLVYTDGIAINASNCDEQCQLDVAAFAEYYASADTQMWINLALDVPGSVPRYLLAANLDFYRLPEVEEYPEFYQFALPVGYGTTFPNEGFPEARGIMFPEICESLNEVMGEGTCPPPSDLVIPAKGS